MEKNLVLFYPNKHYLQKQFSQASIRHCSCLLSLNRPNKLYTNFSPSSIGQNSSNIQIPCNLILTCTVYKGSTSLTYIASIALKIVRVCLQYVQNWTLKQLLFIEQGGKHTQPYDVFVGCRRVQCKLYLTHSSQIYKTKFGYILSKSKLILKVVAFRRI